MRKPTSRISSTIGFRRLSYTAPILATASSPFESAVIPARRTSGGFRFPGLSPGSRELPFVPYSEY